MKRKQLNIIYALALTVGIGLFSPMKAMDDSYQVKTVFVFNFTKYIQWPASSSEFIIGTVGGGNQLVSTFKEMASKKSNDKRTIKIREINSGSDVRGCQIIFIASGSTKKLATILAGSKNENVLIVTEKPGMAKRGSAINFVQINGKLRFELNERELIKRSLKVSGQLKALAILI